MVNRQHHPFHDLPDTYTTTDTAGSAGRERKNCIIENNALTAEAGCRGINYVLLIIKT